ncbi:MAG: homoserine dehydrogenase, partial [Mesorhizobium sp.]
NPNIGTLFALEVMKNGKHIVMLNVEADITIGRFLKEEARKAGVVYTGAAGDEPACTLEIIGFAKSLGFNIIAAGKGKNNPLKIDAMPADYEKEAAERNMNARMLVEFVDGSKTAIEMVAIANATGLVPDVPGMHGPTATLEELASVLCPREDGGVLHRKGVVDYSIGKGVAPGVFC